MSEIKWKKPTGEFPLQSVVHADMPDHTIDVFEMAVISLEKRMCWYIIEKYSGKVVDEGTTSISHTATLIDNKAADRLLKKTVEAAEEAYSKVEIVTAIEEMLCE